MEIKLKLNTKYKVMEYELMKRLYGADESGNVLNDPSFPRHMDAIFPEDRVIELDSIDEDSEDDIGSYKGYWISWHMLYGEYFYPGQEVEVSIGLGTAKMYPAIFVGYDVERTPLNYPRYLCLRYLDDGTSEISCYTHCRPRKEKEFSKVEQLAKSCNVDADLLYDAIKEVAEDI